MTAVDQIAAARALIEPLTGHTPGPWRLHGRCIAADGVCDTYSGPVLGTIGGASDTLDEDGEGRRWWTQGDPEKNAAMFAASPTLRDTVAALADGLEDEIAKSDALAQRIEALESVLGRIALMPHSEDCSSQFEGEDFPCDCHVDPADAALGDMP